MRTLPPVELTPYIEQRFWKMVARTDDDDSCWEWQGNVWHGRPYGAFKVKVGSEWKRYKAHRIGFLVQHGYWPNDLVCHHCDNPRCVRGSHLFDGTARDNSLDMHAKGRNVVPIILNPCRGERFPQSKLTDSDVIAIRARHSPQHGAELAREYGVSKVLISLIVRRKIWKHVA